MTLHFHEMQGCLSPDDRFAQAKNQKLKSPSKTGKEYCHPHAYKSFRLWEKRENHLVCFPGPQCCGEHSRVALGSLSFLVPNTFAQASPLDVGEIVPAPWRDHTPSKQLGFFPFCQLHRAPCHWLTHVRYWPSWEFEGVQCWQEEGEKMVHGQSQGVCFLPQQRSVGYPELF